MFRFDFGEENTKQKQEQEVVLPNRLDAKKITVLNQEEFSIEGGTMFINSFPLFKRTLPDINFEIAQTDDMETENELIEAINSSSDIIRGVYEGGIKTWECSIDLVRYLQSMSDDINGKRILEIGCGSALPGLFCIRVGGVVDFQDYNESVLGLVTIPNIALNTTHMPSQVEMDGQFEVNVKYNLEKMNKYQYFSGDWFHLAVYANLYRIYLKICQNMTLF
jgi:predicted nicotinamide N-methyase